MASAVVGALRAVLSADTADFDKAMKGADANIRKLADSMQKQLVPSQSRVNALVKDFLGSREIGLANAYAKAVEQIGGANKLVASDQAKVNRVVQEALQHYRALGVQAPSNLKALAAATIQAKKPMDDVGMSVTSLLGKMRGLAGVFGVSIGAGALVAFAKGAFDAAEQINDMALKMGVSVEAAQRFSFAAKQSGADIEGVARSVSFMNKNLAEGDKSTVAALSAAGLKFADIRAMKPEEAFRTIADAIGKIPDPMLQSKVAMELFGKSGAELLPMIRENSLKAADSIRVMSDDTVKALDDAKDAWEAFWNDVTIITGGAIAEIMPQIKQMLNDLRVGFGFLAGLVIPGFGNPFSVAKATVGAIDASKLKPMRDLQAMLTDPSAMSSHGLKATFLSKEERDAADKKAKDATASAAKFNQSVSEYIKQWSTGMTSAQREMEKVSAAALGRLGLTGAYDFISGFRVSNQLSSLLGPGINLGYTPPPPSTGGLPMPRSAGPRGPMGLAELLAGVTVPGQTTGALFRSGIGGAFSNLPQTILQAITGGGNIGQSIGSLFGSSVGTSLMGGKLGTTLKSSKLGSMLADFIPGAGALLGPALGKLFGAIGGIGANTTKGARGDFAKQMGFESLDNLYQKLRSLGAEGEKLANVGLNVIGKNDQAANKKWMDDVTAFFDRLEKVPGKVNELSQALARFGGAIPDQLSPLLDSILGNENLSADLRRQLEGMKKPSWQAAQEMAQALGINPAALGAGFNQSRLAEQAFNLKRSLDVFAKFAGSDQNAILKDMADEFSALAEDSRRTGAALPKAVQAFIRKIDEMGLLLDENGNRIDSSLLTFADIEDEYLAQAVSLLEQIRDLLTPPTGPGDVPKPLPPGFTPHPPGTPPTPPTPPGGPVNPDDPGFQMYMPSVSGFNSAYAGAFSGPSMSGMTMPPDVTINAVDAPSFEQFLAQRGGAEAVARTLYPVIERWGHG